MIVVGSMIGSGIFITSPNRRAWLARPLVARGVGVGGCPHDHGRALLRGVGGDVAARWRAIRLSARGLWTIVGFLFGWGLFLIIQTERSRRWRWLSQLQRRARRLDIRRPISPFFASFNNPFKIGTLSFNGYAVSLSTQQLVAVVMILFLTFINTRGLQTGKVIQNTFTFTKTAALLGLIVIGLFVGWNGASAAYTSSWWKSWENGWQPTAARVGFDPSSQGLMVLALVMLLGRAMVGPLFAQSAWNNVTFTAGEVRDPGKICRALC